MTQRVVSAAPSDEDWSSSRPSFLPRMVTPDSAVESPLTASCSASESLLSRALIPVAACYALLFCFTSPFVLLDFPNHFARCTIIDDLLFRNGKVFGGLFSFHFEFSPYIFHDLALALIIHLVEPEAAARIWSSLALLLPIAAVLLYFRTLGITGARLAVAAPVTAYIATDWFFLNGFLGYRFGIALAFLGLAAVEMVLARRSITKAGRFPVLALPLLGVLAALLYLTHLASFLFYCLTLGAMLVFRMFTTRVRFSDAFIVLLPAGLISALHLLHLQHAGVDPAIFRTALHKALALGTMFTRFNVFVDAACFLLFSVVLFSGAASLNERRLPQVKLKSVELLIYAGMTAAAFLMLPVASGRVYDVDNRALPFLFIFLTGAALTALPERVPRNTKAAAILLAVCNLAYLSIYLHTLSSTLDHYIDIVDRIPGGKRVLPVATGAVTERMQPDLHWGTLYTERRAGVVPYLFSGDKNDPMPYFRYLARPPAPAVYWYSRGLHEELSELRDDYDYLIVTKPFDMARLDPGHLHLVYENEAGAVFEIARQF